MTAICEQTMATQVIADPARSIADRGQRRAGDDHALPVSAILSSRAKIKLKIQWYMCSQFYSDWRANNLLILIQNLCAIFCLLTSGPSGLHRGSTR
jgi:hypothetical protein